MAGVYFTAASGEIAISTSAITLIQIVAASNHGVHIYEWSVGFQGIDNTHAPIWVRVVRQTTAGTMSALTLRKDPDDTDETLQTTALHTATAEPTYGDVLWSGYVHPQQGFIWQPPGPHFTPIKIGGGDRVGIVVVADNATSATASARCEE